MLVQYYMSICEQLKFTSKQKQIFPHINFVKDKSLDFVEV
jgi:hypothetical protein